MATKQVISSDSAPAPVGPYSQGIGVPGTSTIVFAAGQLPLDPKSGDIEADDMGGQARVALGNAIAVVQGAGGSVSDIVKLTVYVTDISATPAVNACFEELLEAPYPARTTIEVSALPRGALIEIDAIAAVPAS